MVSIVTLAQNSVGKRGGVDCDACTTTKTSEFKMCMLSSPLSPTEQYKLVLCVGGADCTHNKLYNYISDTNTDC